MDKELIDRVWKYCLPKEFKEEVKRLWQSADKELQLPHDAFLRGKYSILISLFGLHNLTTDAEGDDDEMLCVSRKDMQFYYQYYKTKRESESSAEQKAYYKGRTKVLLDLFGSKCLPDEKPTTQFKIGDKVRVKGIKQIGTIKEPYSNDIGYRVYFEDGDGGWDKEYQEDELIPYNELQTAEPKFKVCDTAYYVCSPTLKHKCTITNVMQNEHSGKWEYNVMFEWGKPGMWIPESDLEPCTSQYPIPPKSGELKPQTAETQTQQERTEPICTDDCPSPRPSQHFDDIIKDGFADHNRLHIAAMLAAGMLANDVRCYPVDRALELADKLIKKSKEDEEQ